jgi:hypothetical protein
MKIFAVAVLGLTFCIPAVAQSSDNSQMKSDNMKSGKTMSMTGCISEKDGHYMMTNKEHPNGVMLMSSDDLKPEVGHKLKATGMMENSSMGMSGSSMKSDNMGKSDDSMKSDKMSKPGDMSMMSMKMTGMKTMSTTCDPTK